MEKIRENKVIEKLKELNGIFLLDTSVISCQLNQDIKDVKGYEEFTSLYEICSNQKTLNRQILKNKRVIILPEVLDEFEAYLIKLNDNKIHLDNRLAMKGFRKVNPYKNNKKISKRRYLVKPSDTRKIISERNEKKQGFIVRYCRLINALYEKLQNKVISYKELPETQDYFDNLEEKILKVQEDIELPDNEKMSYRRTDEKLIITALILGKYTTVNLFTSGARIFNTMLALNREDYGIYSAQELENLNNRPAVRTISFDSWFVNHSEVEFPLKETKIIAPPYDLPESIPTDRESSTHAPPDFSRFG